MSNTSYLSPTPQHPLKPSSSSPSNTDPTPPLTTAPTPLSISEPSTPASPICTELHAYYCMDVLAAHFEDRDPIDPPFENPDESFALFVTWNTTSSYRINKKPALRGCIGNFSPMPLAKGLRDYSLISALEDHRFSPIKQSELSTLSCSVSLLTPFTPISDPLQWIPGVHGIHITFPHPSPSLSHRILSATYLPEVASDQGWTREETILSAIQKAGYKGDVQVDDEVWKSLRVKVYGSVKSGSGWKEYLKWRGERKR